MELRRGLAAAATAGMMGLFLTAMPAQAVVADCATGSYGSNNDGVWIYCNAIRGGHARGRGNCDFAPDIYTRWVISNEYDQNGFCLFSMSGTILETKNG